MVNVAYVLRKVYRGEELYTQLRKIEALVSVCSVSSAAYYKALQSNARDFEDAVQLYSAAEMGAECIITRNAQDFIQGLLPIFNPMEFINSK